MSTTGWAGVAIAATVLSVGGCVTGDRGASASVVAVDTVGGVVHVRNSGETPRWTLREVATISTPDGPASFGQVRALLADSAGNVYIADSKASEIRVFDESGAHLRTMGRQGAGPSEFGSLRAAVPISDAEWEEATREHREWVARAPGVKCDPVEFTRPAAKPAIRDIFHDDAGRMWVEAVSPDGFELDVFDEEGRQVGAIASPGRDGSVRPYVRDDMLYLAAADSLDVQSVRLFRIQR
jgi:hypothetical protein